MFWLELLLLFLVLAFLYLKFSKKPEGLPPGDWGYPVLGNLLQEFPCMIKKQNEKHGAIFSTKMGSRTVVFIADFKLIKDAFKRPELSGRPTTYSSSILTFSTGYGVIWSNGNIWNSNRKFALKTLKDFETKNGRLEAIIKKEITDLLDDVTSKVEEPFAIDWPLNRALLNVIWEIVASKRYNTDDKEICDFWQKLLRNFKIMVGSMSLLDFVPWIERVLPKSFKDKNMQIDELKENLEFLKILIESYIDEHKATFDKNNVRDYIDSYLLDLEDGEADQSEDSFKKDLMNLTVSIMNLFVAGSETTSATLRWFFKYMCKYPEVQRKLQVEIDEAIAVGRELCLEDRERLPYLEATLCEVSRIVSLVPYGDPHVASQDTEIAGYRIPKGSFIISCIELCHMNPEYFDSPTEFRPERFLDSEGKLTSKDGFLPFSIGNRMCLGESLAKIELFFFSAAILQKFTISASDDFIDLTPEVNSPYANFPKPFNIVVRHRDNSCCSEIPVFKVTVAPEDLNLAAMVQTIEIDPNGSEFSHLITKLQSQENSHSEEFEPIVTTSENGVKSSVKSSHVTEFKTHVNTQVSGVESQVQSRVVVRKSQVQSKVTVVKSHTTSSNWQKVSNTFNDEGVDPLRGNLSDILENFEGDFSQLSSTEGGIVRNRNVRPKISEFTFSGSE